MSKLAVLIFILVLLISKNVIKGDRNVNQRSLQNGNLQALQQVGYFGNYPRRDEPINYPGDKRKKKRRNRTPKKIETKVLDPWHSSGYYDNYYDDYESDETHFNFIHQLIRISTSCKKHEVLILILMLPNLLLFACTKSIQKIQRHLMKKSKFSNSPII